MATKNLARTVIEGGRAPYNKFNRRQSNRKMRAQVRAYMHRLGKDLDFYEERMEPSRRPVQPEFRDKTSPAYSWMRNRVGKSWNDSFSELLKTFDTRTTAGRHIVFDHLLYEVREPDFDRCVLGYHTDYYTKKVVRTGPTRCTHREGKPPVKMYGEFAVIDGVLVNNPNHGKAVVGEWGQHIIAKKAKKEEELKEWLLGRKVGRRGSILFWFVSSHLVWRDCPTGPTVTTYLGDGVNHVWKDSSTCRCGYDYKVLWYEFPVGRRSVFPKHLEPHESKRQHVRLTEEEVEYWNSMPNYQQEKWAFNPGE